MSFPPHTRFFVTRVGCGLAGYSDKDMAPLFEHASSNCSFAQPWQRFLAQRVGLLHAAVDHDPTRNYHPVIRQSHENFHASQAQLPTQLPFTFTHMRG